MTVDGRDSFLTRVKPLFTALFARDASGRSWLPNLLRAMPHGAERLGPLVDGPGSLLTSLAVPGARGPLACFEFPVAPPRDLLLWLVDHPGALAWPGPAGQSPEARRLQQVLIEDDPPGARARAQERARERARTASPLARDWWRFEETAMPDCILITDQLVVTVLGQRDAPLPPATPWYPQRSALVRNIEAAKHVAQGRSWASLLLSEEPLEQASGDALASSLAAGAPHLALDERSELQSAYLGNLTWRQACDAVGFAFERLPNSAAEAVGPENRSAAG